MNTISRQLEAIKIARAYALQAFAAWSEHLSASSPGNAPDAALDALAAFLRMSESAERELSMKADEQKRMFSSFPILQARISWNGNERRIVVAKPNAQVGEPFIPEAFYRAIRQNWGMPDGDSMTTREPFEIAVVDRAMRIVAAIGNVL